MSADNVIYIQKRKDGHWWVWMGFASNRKRQPSKGDCWWDTHDEAYAYARGWWRGETVVEYGIQELSPE